MDRQLEDTLKDQEATLREAFQVLRSLSDENAHQTVAALEDFTVTTARGYARTLYLLAMILDELKPIELPSNVARFPEPV
jgi:hypothetical protein